MAMVLFHVMAPAEVAPQPLDNDVGPQMLNDGAAESKVTANVLHPLDDVLESFKASLDGMGSIPRRIHSTFPMNTAQFLASESAMAAKGLKRLAELNPDWSFTLYDDEQMEQYLRDKLDADDYRRIENAHIVEKVCTHSEHDRFPMNPLSIVMTDPHQNRAIYGDCSLSITKADCMPTSTDCSMGS